MTTPPFAESAHPREQSGKFAAKPTSDAAGGLDALDAPRSLSLSRVLSPELRQRAMADAVRRSLEAADDKTLESIASESSESVRNSALAQGMDRPTASLMGIAVHQFLMTELSPDQAETYLASDSGRAALAAADNADAGRRAMAKADSEYRPRSPLGD